MMATAGGLFLEVVVDLLRQGCDVRFRAEGDSMTPTITSGDTVVLRPVRPTQVRPGDIIACRSRSRIFLHRLVAVSDAGGDTWLHLRGDGKRGLDAPLPLDAVIGRVVRIERSSFRDLEEGTRVTMGGRLGTRLARAAASWLTRGGGRQAA